MEWVHGSETIQLLLLLSYYLIFNIIASLGFLNFFPNCKLLWDFLIFWIFFNRMSGKVLCTNIGYFQGTATLVSHCGLLTAATLCAPAGQGAACGFAVCHSGKPASLSPGKYLNSIISTQMYLQEQIHTAEDVFFFRNWNKRWLNLQKQQEKFFSSCRSGRKIATLLAFLIAGSCAVVQSRASGLFAAYGKLLASLLVTLVSNVTHFSNSASSKHNM